MAIRFGIALPQYFSDGAFDPGGLRRFLRRAEELGFHSAWTTEQTLGSMANVAPLELLAYAAACSERIGLGCAVFVSPEHSPVHLAKAIGSVDQLSRGRLEVGFGIGGRKPSLAAYGVDPQTLVGRFTEGIELMKALWTQDEVTFDGKFWQLDRARQEPKPFRKPHPPLWLGGSHPHALRRAAEYGDGFFGAGATTTAKFAEQVGLLRKILAENGRGEFPIAKRVYVTVDDDAERAHRRIGAGLDHMYGSYAPPGTFARGSFATVGVSGTPADVIAGLREVAVAGAELILLHPLDELSEQTERLAAEVIPYL